MDRNIPVIRVQRQVKCPYCKGIGFVQGDMCGMCLGEGLIFSEVIRSSSLVSLIRALDKIFEIYE